jgi:hypothetical protein
MKKNILSQTRQKFDEVETRIIELENAILEFSNSNLNTIEEINNSTNDLLNSSFLLISYFKIFDDAVKNTTDDSILALEARPSLVLSDYKSIRKMSLKSIESIKVSISEISSANNLLCLNSKHLKKII